MIDFASLSPGSTGVARPSRYGVAADGSGDQGMDPLTA